MVIVTIGLTIFFIPHSIGFISESYEQMKKILLVLFMVMGTMSTSAQYRVDRLVTAGRSALYYEDFVLSIKYFNLAIGAKPYLYEPWYYRSVAKFNLDDFTGAESDATEALHLNPYINDIYDLRAICRIRQNRFDDAIADYNEAIRLEPRNRNYWFNRAICQMENKKYEAAQQELDTIVENGKTGRMLIRSRLKCICIRKIPCRLRNG